jgi:hypothetical protein
MTQIENATPNGYVFGATKVDGVIDARSDGRRRACPHPSYQRLSGYDDKGLVWVLEGKPVVAMSSSTAATQDRCDYQLHISQHWGPSATV